MNKPLKLIKVGNSTGVILPKEELRRLGIERGDEMHFSRTATGLELRIGNGDFDTELEAARAVMRKRRVALHKLAQ